VSVTLTVANAHLMSCGLFRLLTCRRMPHDGTCCQCLIAIQVGTHSHVLPDAYLYELTYPGYAPYVPRL
jgi:hypothetical protein